MCSQYSIYVGCSSDDSMGKGKPQLYCSDSYHIFWVFKESSGEGKMGTPVDFKYYGSLEFGCEPYQN